MPQMNGGDKWGIPFGAGFILGLSSATLIKMNVSLDQEYYLRLILSTVCDVTNANIPQGSPFAKSDCGFYLLMFDIITVVYFFASIIVSIKATGKILHGIILYVVGAIIGFGLIFLFI